MIKHKINLAEYDTIAKMYQEKRKDKSRLDFNRDIEVPALIKSIGDVKNKTLLDMGCGFGDHAKKLSKKSKKIIGFDISSVMVEIANNKKIPNATFYVGDMNKKLKEKDSSFDIVYSSLAIHYIANLKKLFSEVNRVLKKNGIFCFTTHHPIFALMMQNDKHMIKVEKQANGKRKYYGNYFDESAKKTDLGAMGKINTHNYTYETLLMSGLQTGFELIEYRDLRPKYSIKNVDPYRYKLTTTLPSFILFKFKKKLLKML